MSEHCEEALERLYMFLDGELTDDSVSRIRMHLRRCPPCDGAYAFEERLKRVVRERLREEVPERVLIRLREFIHAQGIAAEG